MFNAMDAAARVVTRVAAFFLVAMVAINVVDVGLRSGFNAPIFGTYEIVEFLLAAVAFFAIPEAFLRGEHITVELIDQVVSPRTVVVLRATGTLAAFGFVALLSWYMVQPALDFIEFNEVTIDLQLPLIWKASLILFSIGLSVLAVFAILLRDWAAVISGAREP
jgi:TRAP-type C4-dicarboxylate transport system permease small subunit